MLFLHVSAPVFPLPAPETTHYWCYSSWTSHVVEAGAPAYEVLGSLLSARAAAAAPSAAGFSVSYTDAGLVGVTGTCPNGEAGALAQALASCLSVS